MTMPDDEMLREIRSELKSALNKLESLIASSAPRSANAEEEALVTGPRTEAIEWVLRKRGTTSMRPVEIWAALQRLGRDDPKDIVQVATNDLFHRGRIGRSGTGDYHSL
jgi:hypothetical protein